MVRGQKTVPIKGLGLLQILVLDELISFVDENVIGSLFVFEG